MLAALMFVIGATSPSLQHANTLVELLQEQTHTHPAEHGDHAVVADAEHVQHHNASDHTHDTAARLAEFPQAEFVAPPHAWERSHTQALLAAFMSRIDRPPHASLTA